MSYGMQKIPRKIDMMNAQQFIQYYIDAHIMPGWLQALVFLLPIQIVLVLQNTQYLVILLILIFWQKSAMALIGKILHLDQLFLALSAFGFLVVPERLPILGFCRHTLIRLRY